MVHQYKISISGLQQFQLNLNLRNNANIKLPPQKKSLAVFVPIRAVQLYGLKCVGSA